MTAQGREGQTRRDGRLWLVAAFVLPVSPLLFGGAVALNEAGHACQALQGSAALPAAPPCAVEHAGATLAGLGFWAVALAAGVTGLVLGIVEGRGRRQFAQGRWFSLTVVGVCTPWALAGYALGYGVGRLRPAGRAYRTQDHGHGGFQQAVQLYALLAGGQQPPKVFAPDLPDAGTVYMDVPMRYSRFYRMDVTYQPGGMVAVGSPGFVAGAAIGRLIGTSVGYARAASLSRRQWRGHRLARVVVTATATWCQIGGRWLRFDHDTVVEYRLGADGACVLTFADVVPVRLHGPSAWCHAVLYAYLRTGRAGRPRRSCTR
jgi:hypothetical protein